MLEFENAGVNQPDSVFVEEEGEEELLLEENDGEITESQQQVLGSTIDACELW